ncbi:MAG: flagellar motor switch protein FliN [Victivallales bacterium]|nr:flagellar motor switch protein FliN [Victivallales bacterium]
MAEKNKESNIADAEFGRLSDTQVVGSDEDVHRNLEMIFDVPVSISAELGRSVIKIKDLLSLGKGSVVELERVAGEPVDLLVNGVLVGKGDVVVVNDNFGLRITEVVCTEERIKKLSSSKDDE